jgi:putative spermidine/putrescine transport system permease protein
LSSIRTSVSTRAADGVPLGVLPAILTVVVLLGGALVGALDSSLHTGRIVGGPAGTDAWTRTLSDPAFTHALGFTLWIAAMTTLIAVPLAVVLAAGVRRTRVGSTISATPVPMPHIAVAGLAVAWLAPGGLADRMLGGLPFDVVADPRGLGIILSYLYKEVPFLALVVLAAWDHETDERAEAAMSLGAGRTRVIIDVVIPRVFPALGLAAAVVASFVIGATEVPLVIGGSAQNTLATYAIDIVRLRGPAAQADATVALLVAGGLAALVVTVVAFAIRLVKGRR